MFLISSWSVFLNVNSSRICSCIDHYLESITALMECIASWHDIKLWRHFRKTTQISVSRTGLLFFTPGWNREVLPQSDQADKEVNVDAHFSQSL